jgi:hypothetical protein
MSYEPACYLKLLLRVLQIRSSLENEIEVVFDTLAFSLSTPSPIPFNILNDAWGSHARSARASISLVTLQSRVARRYEWRCEVKAKRFLGWGSGRSAWNHEALISSWRGRGPRTPASHRGGSGFLRVSTHPSRCFPPEPPGHNKICTEPPVTEGLLSLADCCLDLATDGL